MASSKRRGFIACSIGNYTKGRTADIDTIVVHYTGTSASAYNNCVYFSRPGAGASAHYFVDKDGGYYQSVHEYDTAWHAGDWDMNCRAIGIEVVSAGEEYTQAQKETLRYLVRGIMGRLGIKASRVIRHYDVTGKLCPAAYCGTSARDAKWEELHDYITAEKAGSPGASSGGSSKPTASKKSLGKVDIQYALRKASDGEWWPWVKNFENKTSEGYAGAPYTKHDAFKAKVTKGSIKYRVRNGKTGVWTPWHKNGEAAVVSAWIDLVEMYYTPPSGYAYQQVWYRAQTTERAGWLPVVCDSGDSIAGYADENAGWAGEPLDRLQAKIADGDPF